MKPIDYLILAVIVLILGAVIWYLHKAKKKGVKCIGCPDGAKCSGNCAGCSGQCGNCK
ncbi:MAG: FeoB-associated Cys-rich membrane protein [Ruminococcaceae bacterium]|nr:FeoB-associated Cys-rich membrane protein [Oscillospiraceae bacterium]